MQTTVRFPAEWEQQSTVQITFPHPDSDWREMLEDVIPCFVEIIAQISRFQKVLVICSDIHWVRAYLQNIPLENVTLVEIPSNDTWARDHGGITVTENNRLVLLDFTFNGWGNKFIADKDNLITTELVKRGVLHPHTIRSIEYVLEGGALETDGKGTLLTTAECLLNPNRNPQYNKEQTEDFLKEWLGIDRVLWLHHGYLAGDDTDSHIDTLARFTDEHTIAYVRCTDASDEHYEALQKMEQELMSFKQEDGTPYKLVALPMPEACYDADNERLPATYANFLIINGAVLIPVYGVPQDGEALSVLQTCFPGRQIIGINCRLLIEQHGSLHCVTMQYPVNMV